jgi:hypothetical protein
MQTRTDVITRKEFYTCPAQLKEGAILPKIAAPHFSIPDIYGRFGNQFAMVRHALLAAKCCHGTLSLPADTISPWAIRASDFDFTREPHTISPDLQALCEREAISRHDGGLWLAGLFLPQFCIDMPVIGCEKAFIGELLKDAECDSLDIQPDELVIRLRSGDIWSHDGAVNNHYGQPPLSWYIAVIQHRSWRKVLLVTEPNK